MKEPIFIEKEEALTALPEYERIHSFRSFIGADWDREAVVDAIKTAKRIAWIDDMFQHNLAIEEENGKVVRFQVNKPDSTPPVVQEMKEGK